MPAVLWSTSHGHVVMEYPQRKEISCLQFSDWPKTHHGDVYWSKSRQKKISCLQISHWPKGCHGDHCEGKSIMPRVIPVAGICSC